MKKIILALAVMTFGYAASAQNVNTLLDKYMDVKNALVSSDSKAAGQAITAFYLSVEQEAGFTQKATLLKAVGKMKAAGDLDQQRNAFNEVSVTFWKVVKGTSSEKPVYYDYCPMKKAYWLSREKEIRNPYYGSAMLSCGKIAESR